MYRFLDRLEQVSALVLYAWLVLRLWPQDWTALQLYPLTILISEGFVVMLLLVRRPTDTISVQPYDWVIACAGTCTALMVSRGGEPLFLAGGAFLMLFGLIVHLWAKVALWRSSGLVAANREVRQGGLYRLVRHPMYAGYMMTHAGFLLIMPTLWNLGVYVVTWALLILRIFAEEKLLSQDPVYRDYAAQVRYRLLPGVF
jgi:protein-S-isoprenylcysteine O-methyltransferase Ste14